MAVSQRIDLADPDFIHPGDIVWLDARYLTPTSGRSAHTWPHYAICLYRSMNNRPTHVIVSGTRFRFVCISSITNRRPFDPATQVLLDHTDPNLGLDRLSAACVDFAPEVTVTVVNGRTVLEGVRRMTRPAVWRVPPSPTLQAVMALFRDYWTRVARGE